MTTPNPYAAIQSYRYESDVVEGSGPSHDYAVEATTERSNRWWTRVFGWAPVLDKEQTPDAERLGEVPPRDFKPTPMRPPQEYYEQGRGRELLTRHGVEDQDADGWTENKGGSGKAAAEDPRRRPPPEPRPTSSMAPRSYSFTRPFDVSSARQLNGLHFSMADNLRTYEILGMAPPKHQVRNTYRLDPAPWDANLVDMPETPGPAVPGGRVTAVEIAPTGNRSWRL